MHDVAVLVPYRPDGGWRDTSWEFIRHQIDAEVVEADDPIKNRPFSMGRAFNEARCKTGAPILALWNADVAWDGEVIEEAANHLRAGSPVVIPFSRMIRLTRRATVDRLAGGSALDAEIVANCCNGLTVIAAEAWQDWDERFEGWGPDDLAWRRKLERANGPAIALNRTCIHLWHPDRQHDPTPTEVEAQARSYELYNREYT